MEYALGDPDGHEYTLPAFVLILVVMEYALGEKEIQGMTPNQYSLNPCCNGICSRSRVDNVDESDTYVLILVVMEYALGGRQN